MNKELYTKLDQYLSNFAVGYVKLSNLHWNVAGPNFYTAHSVLEKFYEEWSELVDEVAEHLRMHDLFPAASLKAYLEKTSIQEVDSQLIKSREAFDIALADIKHQAALAKEIRALADAEGANTTVAMIDDHIARFDKEIWMLSMTLA